ncbi:hypothetical protein LTR70_006624 [Exophiala xenobiotica]|uniref:DUF7918 domain-containing protein n=1 Tax=Lithohypha guttulata TaxID=1690604 RepID=A0ABR0KNM6_9EURO|nr:hypothetical protein LTR24_000377 [Lithohypha guttulata]KAK5315633.1 hypothetical protein LTR70_006624 [Exophiala xenobiotica]
MPCFKGLAVSIHTPDGPLPEHSVQKVSRASRISTYIPVPPPRIPASGDATKAEQSTFAISITLLTPGQDVPYSTPKATSQHPHPKPRVVGALPGHTGDRKYQSAVGPYVPLTTSPNETIAAYIYFDGRAKEEVATLLRRSEETWVNSRWVSVPESEGGGLAEREFLFREVGIERWLNGLDLEGGQDAAAIIEKRRQKLERKRRRKKDTVVRDSDDEMEKEKDERERKKTLRYNANGDLQDVSDDDNSLEDSNTSDDDDPMPEATGQIKIALFRVLASGEIKRGEYSPQFGAHDDDEEAGAQNGTAKDIDHTTSFAKPKTLDPKTISTQTVTGIDPTDKPYATFTFFYRGERQLQKMGILEAPKTEKTPTSVKRRSGLHDLPSLGPLKKEGTVGFLNYRETEVTPGRKKASKSKAKKSADDMSDDEDESDTEVVGKMDDIEEAKTDPNHLSVEDAERAGQVSEGIRKMKLKRQHSAEPLNRGAANGNAEPLRKSSRANSGTASPNAADSPAVEGVETTKAEPPNDTSTGANIFGSSVGAGATNDVKKEDDFQVGSPFKRQRSSMADFDQGVKERLAGSGLANASTSINELMSGALDPSAATPSTSTNDTTGATHNPEPAAFSGIKFGGSLLKKKQDDDDDEL